MKSFHLLILSAVLFTAGHSGAFAQEVKSKFLGTNFWFLAPGWSGERPFIENPPANPYSKGVNIWNPEFIEEISFYSCLRFMDWGATNNYSGESWADRRLPDDPSHFVSIPLGTRDLPGMAYEWMIDLCNRVDADMWVCIPTRANDDFIQQLAELVHEKLEPGLRVYVEYSNEVWNFQKAERWCTQQGVKMGMPNEFETAMKYQVYRSAEIWKTFEEVFDGDPNNRVINVLAGKSTSPWIAENLHLEPAFDKSFNTVGSFPEAYAIAPYFGGNGLRGNDPEIWSKLRGDIFEERPQGARGAGQDSRLQNVKDQYALTQRFDIALVAYEGGQHVGRNAEAPNKDPRMYDIYIEYLNAIAPYFVTFCHYTHVGTFGDSGSWGAKEYTGQPEAEAHKYRAMKDWVRDHEAAVIRQRP